MLFNHSAKRESGQKAGIGRQNPVHRLIGQQRPLRTKPPYPSPFGQLFLLQDKCPRTRTLKTSNYARNLTGRRPMLLEPRNFYAMQSCCSPMMQGRFGWRMTWNVLGVWGKTTLQRALAKKPQKVDKSGDLMEVRIGHDIPETAGQSIPSFDL